MATHLQRAAEIGVLIEAAQRISGHAVQRLNAMSKAAGRTPFRPAGQRRVLQLMQEAIAQLEDVRAVHYRKAILAGEFGDAEQLAKVARAAGIFLSVEQLSRDAAAAEIAEIHRRGPRGLANK